MNNITNLFTPEKSNPFSTESDLYFDVWERPAYFAGKSNKSENLLDLIDGKADKTKYYEDAGHKHIVRMHPTKPTEPISIGLVGKNYKLLKNRELCEGIEETFMDTLSPEELDGVTTKDSISYYGGTSIRDYVFPNIKVDIESKASDIAFRAIVINGYDGSSSFKFYHGAIDFFCTNGMVTGSYDMIVKRHTSNLTVPNLTDRLRKSIDIFYKQAEQWSKWVGRVINDEDAEETFKAMPNVSERRVLQLMRQFHIECLTHGRTVWALYSAATFYATSNDGDFKVRETATDHQASTLLNREQQVRSWLNTDEFQQLAA
jgi:hypothetical protein